MRYATWGGIAASLGYMRWGEPQWLRTSRHRIPLLPPGSPDLRLLHLSDLHASGSVPLEYIQRAIRQGLEFQPDLICVTGDFITSQYDKWDAYREILATLPARAPTFACLGNHDGGSWAAAWLRGTGLPDAVKVTALLQQAGIVLLDNASQSITIGRVPLLMVGVGDLWNIETRPAKAFANTTPGTTLLLCHNPDAKSDVEGYPWDLMLSGHTHGGQLRLPLLGTPLAPVEDKRYVEGLHRWHDRWIHITRGIGNVYGMRFNCRPEVSLLTLGAKG